MRFKVYDSQGNPIAFVKTYKAAEKERVKYLQRTGDNAYIREVTI